MDSKDIETIPQPWKRSIQADVNSYVRSPLLRRRTLRITYGVAAAAGCDKTRRAFKPGAAFGSGYRIPVTASEGMQTIIFGIDRGVQPAFGIAPGAVHARRVEAEHGLASRRNRYHATVATDGL